MSQDDDATIERVARAICEATSGPFEMLDDVGRDALRCEARAAITAYLSALPERELLAEALDALAPFAAEYEYWVTDIPEQLMLSDGNGTLSPADIKWDAIVRARAAADKIRAALTQEPKT